MTAVNLTLLFTAISALGAVAAAIAAWLSARATTKAAEAQLFSTHYSSYGTVEMLSDLRLLRQWEADHGSTFQTKWREALDAHDSRALQVDMARRRVKHYFLRAVRIRDAGYVSKEFLRAVSDVDGINILFDIVEPLEAALNPAYDHMAFDKLRIVCGRTRSGKLLPPIPGPQ